ncbi:MAG: hypothetical protein G01um101425_1017 [Candidatus Peregrinibacteria bacterium Gr01-1014_25]|nr:MAG: hypothetical protein G01um101425_1017 [Candidatus Peregrinibacteria bacterium Gr01-1014_25]
MCSARWLLPAICLLLAACSGGSSAASVQCFYYQNADGTKTAKCGDASSSSSAVSTSSAAASRVALDVPHRQFRVWCMRSQPYAVAAEARIHPRLILDREDAERPPRRPVPRGTTARRQTRPMRSFRILARVVRPASTSSSSRSSTVTSRSASSARTSSDDGEETILDRIRARRASTSSSSSSSRSSSSRSSRTTGTGGTFAFSGEHCPRNRSLIGAVFTDAEATCGTDGWTFPVLMNGDCPISACVLKVQDSETFGSMDF